MAVRRGGHIVSMPRREQAAYSMEPSAAGCISFRGNRVESPFLRHIRQRPQRRTGRTGGRPLPGSRFPNSRPETKTGPPTPFPKNASPARAVCGNHPPAREIPQLHPNERCDSGKGCGHNKSCGPSPAEEGWKGRKIPSARRSAQRFSADVVRRRRNCGKAQNVGLRFRHPPPPCELSGPAERLPNLSRETPSREGFPAFRCHPRGGSGLPQTADGTGRWQQR